MNENVKWVAAAVAVVGLAIGAVVFRDKWWTDRAKPPAEPPVVAAPTPAPLPEEPAIRHPLPAPDTDEALPPLDASDAPIRNALEGLVGKAPVERFVIPENLVRQMVVTIDNLTEPKVAMRVRPVHPTPGAFAVGGTEEAPLLDAANYERYAPLVKLLSSVDTELLVATYTRYYPLFQEAYENLGHPPQYFNDRVIEVIDHLLATPDLEGEIALARPSVQYEFADPALEARSAGQKVLLRMGKDNAMTVKAKLRELRAKLVEQKPSGKPPN
jgi:hypothetical protein